MDVSELRKSCLPRRLYVEDTDLRPTMGARLAESIVHRVILVGIVPRRIVEGQHERVGIVAVDDGAMRIGGGSDMALPHRLNACQRGQSVFETLPICLGQIVFEGEVDAVYEHGGSESLWLVVVFL